MTLTMLHKIQALEVSVAFPQEPISSLTVLQFGYELINVLEILNMYLKYTCPLKTTH